MKTGNDDIEYMEIVSEILKNREYVRKDNIEIIIKRGASVKENSIKLLEIYDKVFMEE